jgi:hypothetical protein
MPLTTYTAGEVLTASSLNDNFTFAASNPPGGLTLIKTQTIGTTVASVTVSDAFSSTYDNYRIVINGGVSSANSGCRLAIGAANTAYYWALVGRTFAGVAVNNEGANQSTFYVGDVTPTSFHIIIDITAPNLAKATGFTSQSLAVRTDGYSQSFSGFLNNSTQYTEFTLTLSTAGPTITGGEIRVYGYANS